jgi:pimeloyl-ACP methyl ester carboxylesterase
MGFAKVGSGRLFYEERGAGVPILLIHPAGGNASTWGRAVDDLARAGRVLTYDRRGYARSGGEPLRSIPEHTADAAALLQALGATPAVVVGQSVGATIAIDLAIRRPDLVRAVVACESPWRARRHPDVSALAALARTEWLAWRGHRAEAAETFLRWAYRYRDDGSAWDAFPEEWRRSARDDAEATLADVRMAIGDYPSPEQLATIVSPVICACGARGRGGIRRIARSLAVSIPAARVREIEGAGHPIAFDAPAEFVQVIFHALGPEATTVPAGPSPRSAGVHDQVPDGISERLSGTPATRRR